MVLFGQGSREKEHAGQAYELRGPRPAGGHPHPLVIATPIAAGVPENRAGDVVVDVSSVIDAKPGFGDSTRSRSMRLHRAEPRARGGGLLLLADSGLG